MQNKFMEEAVRLAHQAVKNLTGGPFGAVIVRENEIVGRGYNQVLKNQDPTAHAEVTAIRDACKALNTFWLNDCVIYTTCEPCPMCLGAIYWARLKTIYYGANRNDAALIGFDDNFFYQEIEKDQQTRSVPMIEFMREAAIPPMHEWMNKQDKPHY